MPLEGPLDGLDGAKILVRARRPRSTGRSGASGSRPGGRRRASGWRYDGSAYELPELAWTQRCFSCALVWLWDDLLYDHESGRFTPGRLLDEGEREFGGYDGLVLWHAYPVIGIDERNQFDFYRDVPGIHELVADMQARGVRVFVDYNPWDTGTRREAVSDAEAIAAIVRELGADGVFLDTMKRGEPGADLGRSPGSRSRASRPSRSPGSAITSFRGRNGSPTAQSPE